MTIELRRMPRGGVLISPTGGGQRPVFHAILTINELREAIRVAEGGTPVKKWTPTPLDVGAAPSS